MEIWGPYLVSLSKNHGSHVWSTCQHPIFASPRRLLRVRGSIASSVTGRTGRGSAAAATAGTAAQLDEGLHANLSATSDGAQNGDLT